MSHLLQKHAATASKASLIALAKLNVGRITRGCQLQARVQQPVLTCRHNTMKVVPKTPPVVNGPLSRELEFRGIVQMNGIYEFSLFNKKLNRGYWIAENGAESGISVRNFDLSGMRITVSQNGRSEQLTLMTATDSPLPVAISMPTKPAALPPGLNIPGLKTNSPKPSASRVIPRRRVILPKKQ